jgi:hypothetical protein
MIALMPLARAAELYARMDAGDARFDMAADECVAAGQCSPLSLPRMSYAN